MSLHVSATSTVRFVFLGLVLCHAALAEQPGKGPVKVFVLVGQSNMQGKGSVEHLRTLATDEKTRPTYGHLTKSDGAWVVRDDVWIWYLGKKGGLTVGYGSPAERRFGPELQFGHVVGDAIENQVLLIKLAWGGKSLASDFRPPGAGGETGSYYRETLKHIHDVLGNLRREFPAYDGKGYELAGLVWFQGWNDRVNQEFNDEYEQNLAHLIRDFRKDLKRPDLPIVIGETGQGGVDEKHPRALSLMRAQAAVCTAPEFRRTVRLVETKRFYNDTPRHDGGYHFFGNAENFFNIGTGLGKAMLELLRERSPRK